MTSFDRHSGNKMLLSLGNIGAFKKVLNLGTGAVVGGLQKRDATGRKKNSEIPSVN